MTREFNKHFDKHFIEIEETFLDRYGNPREDIPPVELFSIEVPPVVTTIL